MNISRKHPWCSDRIRSYEGWHQCSIPRRDTETEKTEEAEAKVATEEAETEENRKTRVARSIACEF
jgi:hypothetical protein